VTLVQDVNAAADSLNLWELRVVVSKMVAQILALRLRHDGQ